VTEAVEKCLSLAAERQPNALAEELSVWDEFANDGWQEITLETANGVIGIYTTENELGCT
jgi:hypothetical protein